MTAPPRKPVTLRGDARRELTAHIAAFHATGMRPPTVMELAESWGWSRARVRHLIGSWEWLR